MHSKWTLKKEKNKELEYRKNDFERRFNEERVLREASEMKVCSLKKRIKEMKEKISAFSAEDEMNQTEQREDFARSRVEIGMTRSEGCDGFVPSDNPNASLWPKGLQRPPTNTNVQALMRSKSYQNNGSGSSSSTNKNPNNEPNSSLSSQSPRKTMEAGAPSPQHQQTKFDVGVDVPRISNQLDEESMSYTPLSLSFCEKQRETGLQSPSQRVSSKNDAKTFERAQSEGALQQCNVDFHSADAKQEIESDSFASAQSAASSATNFTGVLPSSSSIGLHDARGTTSMPIFQEFDPLCSASSWKEQCKENPTTMLLIPLQEGMSIENITEVASGNVQGRMNMGQMSVVTNWQSFQVPPPLENSSHKHSNNDPFHELVCRRATAASSDHSKADK